LLVSVSVAAPTANANVSPGNAHASNSQKKLENALGRLDNRLGSTAARAKKGKKVGSYLNGRLRETLKIVDTFMSSSIGGAKGSQWYRALSCVDLNLTKASLREKKSLKKGTPGKYLASARSCEQSLQRSAGSAGFAALDALLATAIADSQQGKKVGPSIPELRKRLFALADAEMQSSIYGVKTSEWFRKLGCVSLGLEQAKLRDRGTLKRGRTKTMIKSARRCVQLFRKSFKPASKQPAASAITFGSNHLSSTPQSLLGRFNEDIQYWLTTVSPQPTEAGYVASATAPADGMVTDIKVRGFAVDGDNGRGAAQPIRFSVVRPLGSRQVEVVTTTDPPFTLPASDGVHNFSMSQVRWACCRVKKGDVIALDGRFGEHSVFARFPGAITDHFSPKQSGLPTQNPGYKWDGTPHSDVELLMQITMQPGA